MIFTFDSSAALRPTRVVCACLAAVLTVGVPGTAEAGAQNIPCRRPFIFQGAAVNVVVLPYESATALAGAAGIGERLAGLMQLEVLRSIAKFGSVGADGGLVRRLRSGSRHRKAARTSSRRGNDGSQGARTRRRVGALL
jgi:hypothetical protein